MKEARSIAAGVFAFLIFLLLWALVDPDATHSRHGARFLKMSVEESEGGHQRTHTFQVPTFVVNGILHGASIGQFHRELDTCFDRDIPATTLREAWDELQKAPDGTDVSRTIDEDRLTFRKEGAALVLTVEKPEESDAKVVLRVPLSLAQKVMSEDRDLDADSIMAGLREMGKGDLVDVRERDTHVRNWLE